MDKSISQFAARRESAMAGINAEAEQREQLIAETEQRITDLKQQIEKARDIDERMRKLRERRAGGRTSAHDGTDAGRTGSERPDDYEAEQEKLYAQTHQKTVEVAVEKKVPYEKCEKCDRTAYQKAKEKCDNRKSQLEKKYKNMTTGYESILFLLAWYSITTTLFTAILSPVFLNDCIVFFGALGKGMGSLFREFVTGADSFGQLSSGIPNSILSGIVYWLIAGTVMAILFVITGWLIIGIGYQVGKIYRKYCWDIISIVEVITSTAIAIYFGDWIKSVISINLITLLLLVHVVYIGIRCYVKDWMEERGYC